MDPKALEWHGEECWESEEEAVDPVVEPEETNNAPLQHLPKDWCFSVVRADAAVEESSVPNETEKPTNSRLAPQPQGGFKRSLPVVSWRRC